MKDKFLTKEIEEGWKALGYQIDNIKYQMSNVFDNVVNIVESMENVGITDISLESVKMAYDLKKLEHLRDHFKECEA